MLQEPHYVAQKNCWSHVMCVLFVFDRDCCFNSQLQSNVWPELLFLFIHNTSIFLGFDLLHI